jgi:anti-sigma factor RsiW
MTDHMDAPHPSLEDLSAHLDAALDDNLARAVSSHVASCHSCAASLGRLSKARSALQEAPLVPGDTARNESARSAAVAAALDAVSAGPAVSPRSVSSGETAGGQLVFRQRREIRVRLAGVAAAAVVVAGLASGVGYLASGNGTSSSPSAAATSVPNGFPASAKRAAGGGASHGPSAVARVPAAQRLELATVLGPPRRCGSLGRPSAPVELATSPGRPGTCFVVRFLGITLERGEVKSVATQDEPRPGLTVHLRLVVPSSLRHERLVVVTGREILASVVVLSRSTIRLSGVSFGAFRDLERLLG